MAASTSPIVNVDWLREHAGDDDLVIVDVRPRDAYLGGHITGAIQADLSLARLAESTPAAIAEWSARLQATVEALGLGPDKTVVFYEDFSGTMSAFGVWLLDAAGFGNGAMLDGGIGAWQAAGHSVASDDVAPNPAPASIRADPSVVATAGEIMTSLGDSTPTIGLIDTRAAHEYGMGAIPGAVNIEWTRNLTADGQFKPVEDLAAMYDEVGLDPAKPVATYCAGGFRAANTYVVLKALGYANARNYAPSWGEWGRRADTPVERPG